MEPMTKRRILLVEDETSISEPLSAALAKESFVPTIAETVAEGLERFRSDRPDLVLLDVMLPDGDGRDLLRQIRAESRTPVVMLTARGQETDKVVGLELGADDYVVKPFGSAELIARIRAVLRRDLGSRDGPARGAAGGRRRDESAHPLGDAGGQAARADAQGVRAAAHADGGSGPRRQPHRPHRRGVGSELVRLDEDARRPRQLPAQEARRTTPRRLATSTPCAASASGSPHRTSWTDLRSDDPAHQARPRGRVPVGSGRDRLRGADRRHHRPARHR